MPNTAAHRILYAAFSPLSPQSRTKMTYNRTKSQPKAKYEGTFGIMYTSAVTALNVAIATAYAHFESVYLCALCAAWRSVA